MYKNIINCKTLSSTNKNVLMYLMEISVDYETSISLVSLAESINITKPTLIKCLKELEQKNLITKFNKGGRYSKNVYIINKLEVLQ